jgi:hypothetical protein
MDDRLATGLAGRSLGLGSQLDIDPHKSIIFD